jgi:predicted CoA-binding protein
MRVLVYGASENPERYAYKATALLLQHQHEVVLVGHREGTVFNIPIHKQKQFDPIDTVTLYVGPKNHEGLLDYLKVLNPKRVIFNPGTENQDLESELEQLGIQVEEACTLVLLHTGQF